MQCPSTVNIDGADAADLPAMLATLGSYDHMFGPRHAQTLSLAAHIAEVLRGIGQAQTARTLLERVVRDLNRTHATRIAALRTLRDLLIDRAEIENAAAVQTEISECCRLLAGADAPETVAARADLEALLMLSAGKRRRGLRVPRMPTRASARGQGGPPHGSTAQRSFSFGPVQVRARGPGDRSAFIESRINSSAKQPTGFRTCPIDPRSLDRRYNGNPSR